MKGSLFKRLMHVVFRNITCNRFSEVLRLKKRMVSTREAEKKQLFCYGFAKIFTCKKKIIEPKKWKFHLLNSSLGRKFFIFSK